ncbi:MAG: right-handed parallel beta-helix repeat-containing protein [Nitrospiraceae bacterium]
MFRLNQIIGTCILVTAFLPTLPIHAGTYYVATNGNNSNPGTSSQPWRTIAYAAGRMGAGDTTYVRGGTYYEGQIRFKRSGTSSAPIKLLRASGESPVIDFVDKSSSKQVRFENLSGSRYPIGWITFEGFQVRNAYDGIKIYNGHDLTIRQNSIQNSRVQGILGNGTRILIDRNRINNNGSSNGYDHGIYMAGTSITVTNNLIYGNRCYGIQVNGALAYNSSYHPGPEYALSANWVITNNTIAYNRCSGVVLWRNTPGVRAENNIFYENATTSTSATTAQGINFISVTGTGMVFRNNLAYATGSGGTKFLGTAAKEGTHYTQSGNIVNTVNPKFVNAPASIPSSPNFSLASGSPAIDKGLSLSLAPTKISYPGTTRPKGTTHDVGAYEYSGSTTQSLLTAPTSAQSN